MPTDPRTPVIVGVAQRTARPARDDAATWTEPLALMAEALRAAGEDAAPGGATTRSALLERLDELVAIPSFVWHPPDPARAVADALAITPRSTALTYAGGTGPQRALLDAAARILRGELEVAAIVGAEAMRSRDLARHAGADVPWATQPEGTAAPAPRFEVPDALTDHERRAGLALPVHAYALFEHARRRALGLDRDQHARLLGAIAARMSEIASRNPDAWLREPVTPEGASTPTAANRLVSAPYTKLLTSNVQVDMGAAIVVASLGAARAAGVPEDRLVFPLRGAHAKEQWLVSTRDELSSSLAMRACARAVLDAPPRGASELGLLELYSCFPIVVEMACEVLGIDPAAGSPAPSVTGGMTFFGGPGNNFTTHSIVTMVQRLRQEPGTTGLVTGLGWYASTHAWATYSTTPPAGGLVVLDVQGDVDRAPLRAVDEGFGGAGEVEAYTVAVDRGGVPHRAIVAVRTPAGARRVVGVDSPTVAAQVLADDPLGLSVVVDGDAVSLR